MIQPGSGLTAVITMPTAGLREATTSHGARRWRASCRNPASARPSLAELTIRAAMTTADVETASVAPSMTRCRLSAAAVPMPPNAAAVAAWRSRR
ncbi:hypothetical protein [Actinomadura oligospora]|uniref:hypothetical protein n=1 Tax=Actinomadura oligospora TaxID=111804 RepID=UPI00047D6913|nr:hypothetical protein [Actinomadura oligospora]